MKITKVETLINGKLLTLETGKLAKQANSVVARIGDTVVLGTAVISKEVRDLDYLPLKVDYDEKYYAAGIVRPSPYIKREVRPSDQATLIARFIDRSIRPLFPKTFHNEIQVILTVLSFDKENSADIVAAIACNAALAISEAPFNGPVGMCRVGQDNGKFVINPINKNPRDIKGLNMIISSVNDRVIMLDAGAYELSEEEAFEAINIGHEANKEVIKAINELKAKVGKEKIVVKSEEKDLDLYSKVDSLTKAEIEPIYGNMDKVTRDEFIKTLKNKIVEELTENVENEKKESTKMKITDYFESVTKNILRKNILINGKRVGGRGINDIRPLFIETGLLPRTHGSSLFQRGETQALGIITLSGPGSAQTIETMEGERKIKFFHHYNFPPFSVGDISMRRFPGNREIGHGALAEKAIIPVLPDENDFPYTIRAVSEILESNGSSSMASTCCTSLALMDAGVPIKKPVSGIAMGLIVDTSLPENDRNYVVLTDLADLEDYGGFMDFKVTGTEDGITAIQVDMKLEGIPMKVVKDALVKAKDGRLRILKEMNSVISKEKEISDFAPRITTIKIHPDKIRVVIGKGGEMINKIIDETGVEIDISDEGLVSITSNDKEQSAKALKTIYDLTRDLKVGEIIEGTVTRILDFGAIISLLPGKDGLCHVSELANYHVKNVEDILKVGDTVKVKIIETSPQGKTSLSIKQAKEQ